MVKRWRNLVLGMSFLLSLTACGGGGSTPAPVAPKTAATPVLGFDLKTFRFTWADVSDATYYRLLENPDGNSGYSQVGGDIAQGTQTVDVYVPLYARTNASYVLQSCNAAGCTDSSAVNVTGTLVDAIGFLRGDNSAGGDRVGASVSLSADGSTLAFGAYFEDSNTSGINTTPNDDGSANESGAVYVFTRSGNSWSQQAYIKASNPGAGDAFGIHVSLSDDGNTLAVGAHREDSNTSGVNTTPNDDGSADQSGAAYVFTRSGTAWSEQAYIKASNSGAGDSFGNSVSLNADGNTLAVGAYYERSSTSGINTTPDDAFSCAGAAYVFTRSGANWSEQAYIKGSNTQDCDVFGQSVSLDASGDTLAVASQLDRSNTSGINSTPLNDGNADDSGAVYVFTRSATVWSEQAFIKASNPDASDYFGTDVSLSADGNTLAVGAYGERSSTSGINTTPDNASGASTGAAYVYTRTGSAWSEQAYIKPSNPGTGYRFGFSVSLDGSGDLLAVSAQYEPSSTLGLNSTPDTSASTAGAAYTFTRSGTDWSPQAYIKASNSDANYYFGSSLSLSDDGDSLAVGASGNGASWIGAVNLY